ncbi:MAG: GntR family transcriptional regulator [Anaerolineales bacterium]|nr:GntR family transcriptional regulator [Anaerolineales bacterium]
MSLSQQAYEIIKHQIVSLQLQPGAVIDETALQDALGLGRTPIREALKRLELEKLVTIAPRRGMFVTEISITDLQDLFEMRLVLEGLATELAARRGTAVHWQRMQQALASTPWHTAGTAALIAIDEACHQIIYEAADNRFLQDTLQTYYALSLRLWYFFLERIGDMRTAVMEHQSIYDALRTGDGATAARLMRQHIQDFQTEVQRVMLGMPA